MDRLRSRGDSRERGHRDDSRGDRSFRDRDRDRDRIRNHDKNRENEKDIRDVKRTREREIDADSRMEKVDRNGERVRIEDRGRDSKRRSISRSRSRDGKKRATSEKVVKVRSRSRSRDKKRPRDIEGKKSSRSRSRSKSRLDGSDEKRTSSGKENRDKSDASKTISKLASGKSANGLSDLAKPDADPVTNKSVKFGEESKGSSSNRTVDQEYDETTLKELENFMEREGDGEEETEEEKEERLAAERRRRREEILKRRSPADSQGHSQGQNNGRGAYGTNGMNGTGVRGVDPTSIYDDEDSPMKAKASVTVTVTDEDRVAGGVQRLGITPRNIDGDTADGDGDDDEPVVIANGGIGKGNGGNDNGGGDDIDGSAEEVDNGIGLKRLRGHDVRRSSKVGAGMGTSTGTATAIDAQELAAERDAVAAEESTLREALALDMFSASPSDTAPGAIGGAMGTSGASGLGLVGGGRRALRAALLEGEGEDPHLQSNWDDGEGYYKLRVGEMIGERYQTLGVVGKGVFSTVIKCVDLRAKEGVESLHVAIKMIRNNDTMRKAAEKERSILTSIAERDPENKRHCVRMLAHFEFRNHVAMVFDFQQMNLREALKKFGKDVGINVGAVRLYARQLLMALRLLADLRVVHADIKLDNILCSGDLKQVKLCDFGSAFRETDTDNDPTPYLVSRFYRAPEIILGLTYDRAVDLWSVAVCLYELFTGHVMFPGRTNNEMLRLMMAVKGRVPNKLVKTHLRSYEIMNMEAHFDQDLRFKQYELDPVTGKTVLRLVDVNQPTKDLTAVLRGSKAGSDDGRLVSSLTDLLDKCLSLDPAKRITVSDALKHPFFTLK